MAPKLSHINPVYLHKPNLKNDSSPILVTLMMEEIRSSETSVLNRTTGRNIPEDDIRHSHRRENLKSYKDQFNITLPPSPRSSRRSLCLWLSHQNPTLIPCMFSCATLRRLGPHSPLPHGYRGEGFFPWVKGAEARN
jgi:hypothetical protein